MEREIEHYARIHYRKPLIHLFGKKYPDRNTVLKKFPFLKGEIDEDLVKKYYSEYCNTVKKTIDFWNFMIYNGFWNIAKITQCPDILKIVGDDPYKTKILLIVFRGNKNVTNIIKLRIEELDRHEKIVHQEIYDSIINLKPIDKNKFLRKIMNEYINLNNGLIEWKSNRDLSQSYKEKIRFLQEVLNLDEFWENCLSKK